MTQVLVPPRRRLLPRAVAVVFVACMILPGALLFAGQVKYVNAAAAISPSSTTAIMGTYVQFSVTGLTASTNYDIIRSPDSGTTNTTIYDNLASDSDGEMTFRVTFPEEDQYVVYVAAATGNTGLTAATASIDSMDIIGLLMPWIILGLTLALFGGLVAKVKHVF